MNPFGGERECDGSVQDNAALIAAMRNALPVLLAELDRLQAALRDRGDQIAAVEELHQPGTNKRWWGVEGWEPDGPACKTCDEKRWPCPTARALDAARLRSFLSADESEKPQ